MGANEKVAATMHPSTRLAIAQTRSHSLALQAVAYDLEAAGIPATNTRAQVAHLEAAIEALSAIEETPGLVTTDPETSNPNGDHA